MLGTPGNNIKKSYFKKVIHFKLYLEYETLQNVRNMQRHLGAEKDS